jgi:hypothetical protein
MPRDLAGLAALGALGMMMANRKKGADRDTDTGVDVQPSYGQKPMTAAMSPMKDTEFGDLEGAQDAASSRAVMDQFNANQMANKPSRSSMAKVQSAVRNPTGMSGQKVRGGDGPTQIPSGASDATETDFAPSGIGSGKKAPAPNLRFQDRMAMEYLAKKKAEKEKPVKTSSLARPSSYYDSDEMKRGGKVVKMAKGGMASSASSRADGIAQKGKTRGKVC